MTASHHELDETCDGRRVVMFTLENANRVTARIMSYGGTLVSFSVPDRDGRFADVALGFDDLAGYRGGKGYLGAVVGRYANRIAGARFALDGVEHRVTANEGPNHLHGGHKGFDKVVWEGVARSTPTGPALELHYDSAHGEEGYPGNLSVRVVYTLTHDNALAIAYSATTDRDTVVNLTHHAYWNLAGHDAGSILDHRLVLHAERFAPIRAGAIPTGELLPVDGTAFDFRRAVEIGAGIDNGDEQLALGAGYDHSFAIDGVGGDLRPAARVIEPASGRVLEVSTTEPAIQLYSGNWLDVARGKAGATYRRRSGFCLETQHFPDSPNQPRFPPVILKKGAQYRSATIYRFLVDGGNVSPHGDLR